MLTKCLICESIPKGEEVTICPKCLNKLVKYFALKCYSCHSYCFVPLKFFHEFTKNLEFKGITFDVITSDSRQVIILTERCPSCMSKNLGGSC